MRNRTREVPTVLLLVILLAGPPAAASAQASPATRVTARADASVTLVHPHRRDRSGQRLHVGGPWRWRTLLRFDVRAVGPVARATLGVWSLRRPRAEIKVHAVTADASWREGRLTYARAPRLGPVAGRWRRAGRSCRRTARARGCARGQWVWIDVTPALRASPTAVLALTGAVGRTVELASRSERRHAPRLVVRPRGGPAVPAPAPPPTSPNPTPPATGPCSGATPPPAWRHVVWIWMENKAYSQIIGSPDAPYVNGLAAQCGLATDYHAITHPSLPNYIAATSGDPQGVTNNGPPSAHPLSAQSIFGQLGADWRSLQEAMPTNCALTNSGRYAVRHNPAAYYVPIRSACLQQDIPLTGPAVDAAFTFVTPDLCNDTHDCPVATGDGWLQGFVPQVLASPQYQAGDTLLVITWDEDDGSASNHIATLMIAPSVVAGTRDATPYTHYSLLRTSEELLGLPLLGAAATAPSMRAGFHLG